MQNRPRDLREDADLNQTQVAAYLGISQTGCSRYETGENDIPTRVPVQLARFYGRHRLPAVSHQRSQALPVTFHRLFSGFVL